jgi:hypothetical protein
MRLAAAFALLAITFAPIALARESPPTAPPARVAAAREAIRVLLFDTGIYERGIEAAAPQMIEHATQRIEYIRAAQRFSARGEAAVDLFIDDLPELIRSELRLSGEAIVDVTANRAASLFSVEEWRGIAAFFADEDAQRMLMRLGLSEDPVLTAEERELARWYYTPAGRAFSAHDEELVQLLFETWDEQRPGLALELTERVNRQFCTTLADECPPDIRQLIARD